MVNPVRLVMPSAARPSAALVLAAGKSTRMRDFKQLLPLGGRTVLGQVIHCLRQAGVEHVLVVAGHNAEQVAAEAGRLCTGCVVNPDFEQGMFSSVLAGLKALPGGFEALAVMPADIPLVRPRTIRKMMDHFRDCPVLYPTFLGKRGHPPLIAKDSLPFISSWKGDGGLGGALRALEARLGAKELPVADANILFDLDTPEDYREALEMVKFPGRPSAV